MNANAPSHCPHCNAVVQPGQEYCLDCGTRLPQTPAGPVARASATVAERHEWAGAWLVPALLGLLIGQAFDATVLPLTLGYFGLGAVCLAAVLWAEGGVLFRPHNPDPAR